MSVRDYAVTGPGSASRALGAAWLDIVAGGLLAMIALPFPLVRSSIVAALPSAWLPAFAGAVLAAFALGSATYPAVTAAVLGRTPGMYLLDLGFDAGRPSAGRAAVWSLGWVLAAGVALAFRTLADPAAGLAARVSGLRAGSTVAPPA